jgi:ribosomal protein L12E/L44/L45/RPP1/RPP2
MKRLLLLLSCSGALLGGAELSGVHTVYVLSMSKGLDQYLANRLTNDHVFQVVTDPKRADAFLTDRIGESLQSKLEEIFPPPAPEKAAPAEKAASADKPAPAAEKASKADKEASSNPLLAETVNKLASPGSNSFSRSKGTVFLVDAKSRQVVWSAYELPKGSSAKAMDRTASDIVSRLKRDLKGK